MSSANQLAEKLKALEGQLREKERELGRTRQAFDQGEGRVKELEDEAEERTRALGVAEERAAEASAVEAEREGVLERCGSMLEALEVSSEEYLTHYFRTNGLLLEPPRPSKSKYNMVFD